MVSSNMPTYAVAAAIFVAAAPRSQGFIVQTPAAHYHGQRVPGRQLARNAPARATAVGPLQMNLINRFAKVAQANLNSLLQKVEDPEKVLEQAVEDMQRDLIKVRQSYAEVSATQRRLQRQKEEAEKTGNEWYKRAQLALQKGDENLAREALSRRQQQVDNAATLTGQIEAQGGAIERLYGSMQQLESRITDAKGRKEQLIARARTAKTSQQVNDMLSSLGGNSGMEAFDRMSEKVDQLEAKAEVSMQLSGTVDGGLEQQFRQLEGSSSVEDELAKMKMGLPGMSEKSTPRALPPAAEKVDSELDALRREMSKPPQ